MLDPDLRNTDPKHCQKDLEKCVMVQVRYFLRGGQQAGVNTTLTTRKEELEISGLAEKTEYGFQVPPLVKYVANRK
jgi:hypothetical protein